jgi:hypothetical protein
MGGFDSEATAYIVGIVVGLLGGVAVLGAIGAVCYKRLGISSLPEEDDELTDLKRQASIYEKPASQSDPNERAELPA